LTIYKTYTAYPLEELEIFLIVVMRLWQPVTALNFSEFAAFSLADVQGKNNAYIYLCSSHHPPHTTPRLLTFVWWFSTKDNCAFPRASWQCHSVLSAIIRLVVLYKSAQKSPMEKSNSSLSLSLFFRPLLYFWGVPRRKNVNNKCFCLKSTRNGK